MLSLPFNVHGDTIWGSLWLILCGWRHRGCDFLGWGWGYASMLLLHKARLKHSFSGNHRWRVLLRLCWLLLGLLFLHLLVLHSRSFQFCFSLSVLHVFTSFLLFFLRSKLFLSALCNALNKAGEIFQGEILPFCACLLPTDTTTHKSKTGVLLVKVQ